jgi:hypothetical protein
MFRALTPDALREGTEIVVFPPAGRVPDPGDTPNHAVEGAAMKLIAWAPAVSEHEMGIPKAAGSLPSTRMSGTTADAEHGMLLHPIVEDARDEIGIAGGREVPQP